MVTQIRRVLPCSVPLIAYRELQALGPDISGLVVTALEAGLSKPLPRTLLPEWRCGLKRVAVPISTTLYDQIIELAGKHFDGEAAKAAGWFIAFGLGLPMPCFVVNKVTKTQIVVPVTTYHAAVWPRPVEEKIEIPVDKLPTGEELAKRRKALGISQYRLADLTKLSRGNIVDTESGRRRGPGSRSVIHQTLQELEANPPKRRR